MERAGRLIGKMKFAPSLADPESRARAAWTVAAGKKIAEHTRATTLVRGTLIIEVEDHIWQRQLSSLRHFLLRNLTKTLGEAVITDLDFRPMPARRKPQRADAARPSDPIAAPVSGVVTGIGDPVLALLYRNSKGRNTA